MNKTNNKYRAIITFLGILTTTLLFTSCTDDSNAGPITINKVYLEEASSSVPDREVTFARLGQLVRIEGTGFSGLKEVYINGYSTYFNPVLVSDNSMLISISRSTPIVEALAEDRNTIRFVNDKYETSFTFDIRSAAPTITNISHTMPLAGETITVFGSDLIEVSKVVFPGNIEVTNGITSNSKGEYFTVVVPDNVSEEGGSLYIECANGGAYSPKYFNYKNGLLLNFDGAGTHSFWGTGSSMIQPEDLESASIGTGHVSQGTYVPHRPARIETFDAEKNRLSEVWTADAAIWREQFKDIPTSTPAEKVAFQFDVFVPEAWSGTGFLKVCLYNGFGGGEWNGYCYNYVPWLVDGEIVPFQTTGWTTVTIPFSEFYTVSKPSDADKDKDFTFEDFILARENTKYKSFGLYFENSKFTLQQFTNNSSDSETEFPASPTSVKVYTDNWRIVPLETPLYSDFSD